MTDMNNMRGHLYPYHLDYNAVIFCVRKSTFKAKNKEAFEREKLKRFNLT